MDQDILNEISILKSEIERIELTFPPNSSKILVQDIEYKIDKLSEQYCPF